MDENCDCPVCNLIDKTVEYIKVCETEAEIEYNVRKLFDNAFSMGYKECLMESINENIALLDSLDELDEENETEKQPNLRVVDNIGNKLN